MTRPVIGWDTETHLISPSVPVPDGVCLTASGGFDTLGALLAWDARTEGTCAHADLVFYWETEEEWALLVPFSRAEDFLLHMLGTTDAVLVAQNQPYDWSVVLRDHPELLDVHAAFLEAGRLADSGVREQLWAIATDNFKFDTRLRKPGVFSLASIVQARFGVDLSEVKSAPDAWRLRYKELDGVPVDQWPSAAVAYAIDDAIWARRAYLDQAVPLALPAGTVVNEDGTVVDEVPQDCFNWFLRQMSTHGVCTDGPAVDAFAIEVEAMVVEAERAGQQAGFLVVNACKPCSGTGWVGDVPDLGVCPLCEGLDHEAMLATGRYGTLKNGKAHAPREPSTRKSLKRLKALVDHAYGGHPPLTDKGGTSTDAETLQGSANPLLIEYAKGSFATKLRDTYLPALRRGTDHPIYSSPRVLVRSGRTSWSDPNFQNPPQRGGFRECFVPRPGNVFASIDYAMLEMCTLAQVCLRLFGYTRMAEAINAGRDLHSDFAVYLEPGWTYEELEAARRDKHHPRHARAADLRQRAKVANFGFPGGLGAAALVEYAKGYGLNLTLNDAEDLKAAWLKRWPELVDYFNWVSAKSNGSYDGRFAVKQLVSGRVRGGCSYTSGANTMFQGLAADGAKAAGWSLYKEMYLDGASWLYGVRVWAFVHDEYLFEGPEATAHLWAPLAAEVMIRDMRRYTPDVTIGAEPALMRRWSKKAEAAYVDGVLVPWEDVK